MPSAVKTYSRSWSFLKEIFMALVKTYPISWAFLKEIFMALVKTYPRSWSVLKEIFMTLVKTYPRSWSFLKEILMACSSVSAAFLGCTLPWSTNILSTLPIKQIIYILLDSSEYRKSHHLHVSYEIKSFLCEYIKSKIILQLYHGGQFYWWRKLE
jgi:hypothetical protein